MSQHVARIARDHCLAPERVDAPVYGGRYRLLFEDLPPLEVDEEVLRELGRPGGEHFGPCPVFPDLMGFGPVPPEHTVDQAVAHRTASD
jgi:hypothetical protein